MRRKHSGNYDFCQVNGKLKNSMGLRNDMFDMISHIEFFDFRKCGDLYFQYSQREWGHFVLEGCSDKEKAFENWMERDVLFAEEVRRQCERERFMSIVNDGAIGKYCCKTFWIGGVVWQRRSGNILCLTRCLEFERVFRFRK